MTDCFDNFDFWQLLSYALTVTFVCFNCSVVLFGFFVGCELSCLAPYPFHDDRLPFVTTTLSQRHLPPAKCTLPRTSVGSVWPRWPGPAPLPPPSPPSLTVSHWLLGCSVLACCVPVVPPGSRVLHREAITWAQYACICDLWRWVFFLWLYI